MKINNLSIRQYLLKELTALNLSFDSDRVQQFKDYYLSEIVSQVKRKEISIDAAVRELPFYMKCL